MNRTLKILMSFSKLFKMMILMSLKINWSMHIPSTLDPEKKFTICWELILCLEKMRKGWSSYYFFCQYLNKFSNGNKAWKFNKNSKRITTKRSLMIWISNNIQENLSLKWSPRCWRKKGKKCKQRPHKFL